MNIQTKGTTVEKPLPDPPPSAPRYIPLAYRNATKRCHAPENEIYQHGIVVV